MANVLEKIVADKRIEINERIQKLPLEEVKKNLTPSSKSLYDALKEPNAGFILECKKASPSKGLIRAEFDLDEILAAYTPHAAGISVLTDEKYFQGKFEYLEYVTQRVPQPVLNKDFFVTPYQVYLARYYQADAILLMLSVLDDNEYKALAEIANELSLDILTEVSNEEEAQRAINLEAKIIGINNRNLRDLSTDLSTSEKLIPLLDKATHEFVVISESGIYTQADVRRLSPICDGFLVGSALMAEPNLAQAVQQLLFGKIKICGMKNASQAQYAVEEGASYLGLIFAQKSPRYINPQDALSLVNKVEANYVGVFVNAPIEQVADTAKSLSLSAVQLHGEETTEYRQQLRTLLADTCEIWQAVGIDGTLKNLSTSIVEDINLDRILLDCQVGNEKGGTGRQFDWSILSTLKNKNKFILAGGINIDNVGDALNTGLSIIDVNSGIEDAPADKSIAKIEALFTQCRTY